MKRTTKTLSALTLILLLAACTKGTGPQGNDEEPLPDTGYFTKNVLIMEFVSFDCVYCPRVTNTLKEISERTHPGRIDIVSVHGRLQEDDPMEFKGYKPFQNYFYGVTGYPGVTVDQRDDLVTVGTFDPEGIGFLTRLKTKTSIGIELASTLVDNQTARVDVKVFNKGKASGNYRLAALVLENDLPYRQADLVDGSQQWIENYQHHDVLRAFLCENYFGDPIGNLAENGTYSKSFTYTIPPGYKKEKLTFVAYVIEAEGFSGRVAVNSRSAPIGKAVGP